MNNDIYIYYVLRSPYHYINILYIYNVIHQPAYPVHITVIFQCFFETPRSSTDTWRRLSPAMGHGAMDALDSLQHLVI